MKVYVSSLESNRQKLDGGAMFGNAPKAMWERWLAADAQNRVDLATRCLLIEAGNCRILCECGIGAFFAPDMAARYGVQDPDQHRLLRELAELGLGHEQIDYVLLSHLHFDHAGGLLPAHSAQDSELLFPNARYLLSEEAFARALKPHRRDRASFVPLDLAVRLRGSGRLQLVSGATIPGLFEQQLRLRYSSGHTPGQMHVHWQGQAESVFYAADLIPGRAWMHAAISMGYDRFPESLIDEKEALLAELSAEKAWIFFTHDPEVAAARCALDGKKRYAAVEPQQQWRRYELS